MTTIWTVQIPDARVPIDVTQTYDSSTDIYDNPNDSYDGSYPNGYEVIWTVKSGS